MAPADSDMMNRRDSWPPTQVRLEQSGPKQPARSRPSLEDIDEDPFTYFLTEAPPGHDDVDDYGAGLDAGIEDPNNPQEMVRSVSPSSLDGLRRPDQDRPSSPECDSSMTSLDGEDDDEDDDEDEVDVYDEDDDDLMDLDDDEDEDEDEGYTRFSPHSSRLTSFRDISVDPPAFGRGANALLSPASFPAPAARRRGRARSLSVRARPTHLWRVPSPDVWSIEEETEEQLAASEMTGTGGGGGGEGLDGTAAKPKKKVRFLLPAKGEY